MNEDNRANDSNRVSKPEVKEIKEENEEEPFKLLEDKQPKSLGLRRITEEEAKKIRGEKYFEQERATNLKLLMNIRPGVFDPEDQA